MKSIQVSLCICVLLFVNMVFGAPRALQLWKDKILEFYPPRSAVFHLSYITIDTRTFGRIHTTTDTSIEAFSQLAKSGHFDELHKLVINGSTQITQKGWKRLGRSLHLPHLHILDLSDNELDNKSLENFLDGLNILDAYPLHLSTLILKNNWIHTEGIQSLATFIETHDTLNNLRCIVLNRNYLLDKALNPLMKAVKHAHRLEFTIVTQENIFIYNSEKQEWEFIQNKTPAYLPTECQVKVSALKSRSHTAMKPKTIVP